MKLKEIWQFIKTVIWPAAKPFICASKEEAMALKAAKDAGILFRAEGSVEKSAHEEDPVLVAFFARLDEALKNEI